MVMRESEALALLEQQFYVDHLVKAWWDPTNQELNVQASQVKFRGNNQIPVKLGTISGRFECDGCGLTTLQNAPHTVTGEFTCSRNQLKSLEGGPRVVQGNYMCNRNMLVSLQGAPQQLSGLLSAINQTDDSLVSLIGLPFDAKAVFFTWHPDMPLLKLIEFPGGLGVFHRHGSGEHFYRVEDLIMRFRKKGKSHVLNLALELKKQGLEGNAKW